MNIVIKPETTMRVLRCECGHFPEFVQPDCHYTDVWLECPKCGKSTYNTGGYHYAEEISLEKAKEAAVLAWNNKEFCNK